MSQTVVCNQQPRQFYEIKFWLIILGCIIFPPVLYLGLISRRHNRYATARVLGETGGCGFLNLILGVVILGLASLAYFLFEVRIDKEILLQPFLTFMAIDLV